MDVVERIKRGYRAIGPGASRDVLAMFHQEDPDAPDWVVEDVGSGGTVHPAREVVALDLFRGGLPSHWEVIGVDLRLWDYYENRSRLVVAGRFRTRPRGTWEVVHLPFIHIWSFADGEVEAVFDYMAGIEVRRRGPERRRRSLFRRKAAARG
jgi:hypothetical protein